MSQSNVIFAAIFVAYLVFITMRGEVPIYLGLLLKSPAASSPLANPVATGQANSTGGVVGDFANAAVAAAPYVAAF